MSVSARLIATLVASLVATGLAGCARDAGTEAGDALPGRERPLLAHDWAHPRDLTFPDNGFRPPDPREALHVAPNGLRAYVLPEPSDGVVQVVAVVPSSPLRESAGEAGASDVLARALIERLRARLPRGSVARTSVDVGPDLTRVTAETLPEDWEAAMTAVIGALRAGGAELAPAPGARAGAGGGGGAGQAVAELTRMVATDAPAAEPASADAVRGYAARVLDPASVVVAIGGAATREAAEAALHAATDGWTSTRPAAGPAPSAVAPTPRAVPDPLLLVDEPGTRADVAAGHAMPAVDPGDEAALAVLAEVLNIRINIATREMRGLTNRAQIDLPRTRHEAGVLAVRGGARHEAVLPMLRYALEEVYRIRTGAGAPTNDEMEQAKGGLALGQWQGTLDGARRASATYAVETVRFGTLDRLNGWPAAVRAVTPAEVTAAAGKYIRPASMAAVVVGPMDAVREARHPRWPYTLDELRGLLRENADAG